MVTTLCIVVESTLTQFDALWFSIGLTKYTSKCRTRANRKLIPRAFLDFAYTSLSNSNESKINGLKTAINWKIISLNHKTTS